MRVEAAVLGGDDGVAQRLGNVRERNEDPSLDVQLGQQLVVVVIDLGALQRLEGLERLHRGQTARQDRERPQRGDARGGGHDERADADDHEEDAEPPPAAGGETPSSDRIGLRRHA